MARMHPDAPSSLVNDSERIVYEWIKAYFPDSCEAYCGMRWKDNTDMESDFLIFHPEGFIILLEVKGGDGWARENGKWKFMDGGKPNTDPDDQYMKNSHSLINKFSQRHGSNEFSLVGGLVFPQWWPSKDLGNLPVSAYHLGTGVDLYEWVEAKLIDPNRKYVTNPAKIADFLKTCDGFLTLETFPKLLLQIEKSSDQIGESTMERLEQTLDDIKSEKKVLITGRAGCGKTWLVKRLAEFLYADPQIGRILITCKTESLVDYLKTRYPNFLDKCVIEPLFVYAEKMLNERNDMPEDLKKKKNTDTKSYWNEIMNVFSKRIQNYDISYDAVIVDEAQMLNDDSWDCIRNMVDIDSGYIYVFSDLEQRIYKETENKLPDFDFAKKRLRYNIRNTGNIYRFATAHYKDPNVTSCARGDDGLPVWMRYYSGEEDMRKAIVHFRKILLNQGVDIRDIILLTPKKKKSCLYQRSVNSPMKIGKIKLEDNLGLRKVNSDSTLFRTTVQNFRGRERNVVILAEFDESVGDFEKLIYIGATRAKSLLIVLADQDISEDRKALYADYSLDISDCHDIYENIMRKQSAA